jgi:hypothetical protein
MTKNVLLLGRTSAVIGDAEQHLDMPGVQLIGATGIDDVRAAFARLRIDHVIMGAGLDLEDRMRIVREIFQLSTTATVHMKNREPGPEGFLPFARSVLRGLLT